MHPSAGPDRCLVGFIQVRNPASAFGVLTCYAGNARVRDRTCVYNPENLSWHPMRPHRECMHNGFHVGQKFECFYGLVGGGLGLSGFRV